MNQEKNIVRIAVIGIMIIIGLVYTISYRKHKITNTISEPITIQNSDLYRPGLTRDISTQKKIDNTNNSIIISPNTLIHQTQSIPTDSHSIIPAQSIIKINNNNLIQYSDSGKKILPGTTIYIGGLDTLKTLNVVPDYILRDKSKPIYYSHLDKSYNRGDIASKYNGTIKELITQVDIQQNKLFGDKITYINLPQYSGQIVLMVVNINTENRLIQIPYDIYHQSKQHIKSRF